MATHARRDDQFDIIEPYSVGDVLAVFAALGKCAARLTVGELSAILRGSESSRLELLASLVAENYLCFYQRRYQLGPAAFSIASKILQSGGFESVCAPPDHRAVTETADDSVAVNSIQTDGSQES